MKTYIIIPLVILFLAVGLYLSNQYEYQTNSDEIKMYRCSHSTSTPFLDSIWDDIHSNKETYSASKQGVVIKKENYKLFIKNTDFEYLPDDAFEDVPCIEGAFFSKNKFKTIPHTLRHLTNLQDIILSKNNINTLQTTAFEELYQLDKLYFSNNPIKKFVMPVTQSELISLECQFCELTEVGFIPFTYLRELDLSNNQLTRFPIDIFNFTGLKDLKLNNNRIENFDFTEEEMQRFSYRGLNSIDLSHNQLTRFPRALGNLTNLQHLNLYDNKISGKMVTEGFLFLEKLELPNHAIEEVLIRNVVRNNYGEESTVDYFLSSMQEFNLKNNQIKSFEVEGGKNKSIHTINLRDNQLTTFPKALYQFKQLQNIYLSNNNISSVYLLEAFQFPIINLDLSRNQIKEITTQVNKVSAYEKVNLSYNKLSRIPIQFITFSTIKKLDLSHNQIKTLYSEKWNRYGYEQVEELDLSHNPIQKWNSNIIKFKNLRVLNLSYTDIDDIPIEDLKKMPNLEKLILKNTEIPEHYSILYELLGIDIIFK